MGPIAALPVLLVELGADLDEAFEGTGIRPEDLTPEARFPYPALIALVEQSAAVSDCAHLGLLLGARNDHRALGAVGEMMASAATLGDALRDYIGLQIGYSRGASVYLQSDGDDYLVGYGLYDAGAQTGRQVYDLVVALGCGMVRGLTGGRIQPLRTVACVGRPENPALYRSTLRLSPLFDQERTGILLSREAMATPLPGANAARHLQLRTALESTIRGELDDVAARVRHLIRPRLMVGEADRDSIARELMLEPRTLARHLARAGTSFDAIKDEVRFTVARELLAMTRLPIGRIGDALSYATNSSFDHAFRRWAGIPPSRWRAEQWITATGRGRHAAARPAPSTEAP